MNVKLKLASIFAQIAYVTLAVFYATCELLNYLLVDALYDYMTEAEFAALCVTASLGLVSGKLLQMYLVAMEIIGNPEADLDVEINYSPDEDEEPEEDADQKGSPEPPTRRSVRLAGRGKDRNHGRAGGVHV